MIDPITNKEIKTTGLVGLSALATPPSGVQTTGLPGTPPISSPYYNVPKPVSAISTEQAKTTLQNAQTTHAADVAQLTTTEKNAQINKENAAKKAKESAVNQGGVPLDEITTLGGDVSKYDYSPSTGLYIPKPTAEADPRIAQLESDQKDLESTFAAQQGLIDAATARLQESIRQIFDQRISAQKESNARNLAAYSTLGYRSGTARYAPSVNQSILSGEEKAGMARLDEIAALQTKAIQEASTANGEKSYQLFVKKADEIVKYKAERNKILGELQKTAIEEKKKQRENIIKASRDGAISGLLQQGITDPEQILQYLNYDDSGKQTGDFTAKEVGDTLKNLAPNGDLKLLDANTRAFFVLKGTNPGAIPADIMALPEDQQLMAWLNKQKKTTVSTGASGPKITFAEAKNNNLPISTVGMSEKDVVQSLYDTNPPDWFKEKLQAETAGQISKPVEQIWDEYRKPLIGGTASETASGRSI